MLFIRLLPVTISCWLLAAHFLRFSLWLPFIMLLLLPLILSVRQASIPKLMSLFLVLIAGQWVLITYDLINLRLMMGADWQRLAAIMMAVISVTLASIFCFSMEKVQSYYRGRPRTFE
ncbi:hypothetical protein [Photobacterium nomapromontoriensis]|uniref:hypothetical protein n=1 Tax=Photobacterium nomapromontoriensis TaxID=2910237 RepID=UPI003D0B81BD